MPHMPISSCQLTQDRRTRVGFTMNAWSWLRAALAILSLSWASVVLGDAQRVFVQTEIDDDHIIIVTEGGEQLLLEKWSMRFSPLLFEGKEFLAEVSPMWVTIHIPGNDPLKWSIEETLGRAIPKQNAPEAGTSADHLTETQPTPCYKTSIQEPIPFNGNGGELIMLADGSIWKEVTYQYLYLYEYYPEVVICPAEGRMVLKSHVFQLVPLN